MHELCMNCAYKKSDQAIGPELQNAFKFTKILDKISKKLNKNLKLETLLYNNIYIYIISSYIILIQKKKVV